MVLPLHFVFEMTIQLEDADVNREQLQYWSKMGTGKHRY